MHAEFTGKSRLKTQPDMKSDPGPFCYVISGGMFTGGRTSQTTQNTLKCDGAGRGEFFRFCGNGGAAGGRHFYQNGQKAAAALRDDF